MKSIIKKTALSLMLASCAGGAMAQTLNSGYFMDGFTYRHETNPAYMDDSYFSMPILGQFNVGFRGNIGLENFIFTHPDPTSKYELTTGFHPDISAGEFLGELTDNNKLMFTMKTSIFSMGFKGFGGFNTIGLNLRMNMGLNLPYGLFEFAKRGMYGDTNYQLDDLSIRARGWAELALGHARPINENLTVGAKLKFLVGGADFEATLKDAYIDLKQNMWRIKANAEVNASLKGAYFTTDADGEVDGLEVESPGIGGFGLGLDLGATYKFTDGPLEGLKLSAAVLELGFINWADNAKAVNDGEEFVFEGFKDIAIDDNGNGKKLEDQMDDLGDDLEKLYNVRTDGEVSSRKTMLAATLNFGAEYPLPMYDKLKFGLLSSTYIDGPFTWTEGRLSANVNPTKWFGASVNYALSTFGSSFGMLLNFHPKGFNLFVGTDCMLSDVNTQFIPLNSNANVVMGVNFILGHN